ncbi:MAG: CDP-alcohol phosphatidyltransferase family protein, partial [archaeon]
KVRKKSNPLTGRIVKPLAKLGVKPNQLTFFTIILALVTGWFILNNEFLAAAIMLLVTGLFDVLDGALARERKMTSKSGAYYDAMIDRYVDSIIIIAVIIASREYFLGTALLAGVLIIPYAKARAGMEVKVSNVKWPDLMERAERLIVLIVMLFVAGFSAYYVFPWFLGFLAIITHLTVLQRMVRARKLLH